MDGQGFGSEESESSWAWFKPVAKLDLGAGKRTGGGGDPGWQ